jgi:hypothetical protein
MQIDLDFRDGNMRCDPARCTNGKCYATNECQDTAQAKTVYCTPWPHLACAHDVQCDNCVEKRVK